MRTRRYLVPKRPHVHSLIASPPLPSSSSPIPSNAGPGSKQVLLCYGDRKKPVYFSSIGNGTDITQLLVAANVVCQGMGDSKTVVQVKSAEWGGEFVDAVESIPDNSILCLMHTFNKPLFCSSSIPAILVLYVFRGSPMIAL